ncbi:MAG: hypothetical protein WBX25_16705 [Rhodomicrobium sp.]
MPQAGRLAQLNNAIGQEIRILEQKAQDAAAKLSVQSSEVQ